MQRFILQGNIERYQTKLACETEPSVRLTLGVLLAQAQRELALFDSGKFGSRLETPGTKEAAAPGETVAQFFRTFADSPRPYLIIDPGPGLKIVDANTAYCNATMIVRSEVAGRPLFEVFPDNPEESLADGVSNLFHSLQEVFATRRPHEMAIQRYDIRNGDGAFEERYWKPVNSPLFDGQGEIKFILHHVEDVTGHVIGRANPPPSHF